ncbi:MAG: hypothetical protein ACOX7H_07890 [Bacillota bacterium]|jgi:hypothetical protein
MVWKNDVNKQTQPLGKLDSSLLMMLNKGHISHAYLFCGSLAQEQALLLSMVLNCLDPHEGQPCGLCLNCKRIKDANFTDVRIVRPDNNYIRLEQLKRIQAEANLQSYQGGRKIFIIHAADSMKDEAANSLLKILEEPPEDTIFILCADKVQGILPTILSRCQYYNFGLQSDFVIEEALLQELEPQAEEFFYGLCDYPLDKVLIFSQQWHKDRESLIHFLSLLLRLLYGNVKGERGPFKPAIALEAALFCERGIDLLLRNINQRLLADVLFIRLWRWAQ